ncbi:hypothetical protein MP228_001715 [Amoeboaphelidium protococcarum]|nr:hypothetical protein MP228_001715 [Amoeboaphelidium protococcarum]
MSGELSQKQAKSRNVHRPVLFEIAWEVANKVGGIYTVIKTKVPVTLEEYSEKRYFLIGPYNSKSASLEVEPVENAPDAPSQLFHLRTAINALRSHGVNVVFGKWLIEGSPYVILLDINSVRHRTGEWRGDLYQSCQIPSPENDWEMNDAILFGYLVAWFLGEYAHQNKKHAVIAHFHEWQSSVGLILAKQRNLEVATVFTTHATLLGRYLCAGSVDFYNSLHLFDVDYEAGKRGIYHRYCVERGAANCANVFTTVSHITAYEAEHLLKKKADGITPNGLNVGQKGSALHEFQNLHAKYKSKIHDFVRGHFYGHLDFDLDNTLYFFTAGRYEYRNKGVDMYLNALNLLNQKLRRLNSPITVVAFVIMPAATNSYSVEALKGQAVMKQLKETVHQVQENIGNRIFESCASGKLPDSQHMVMESEMVLLKRRIYTIAQHHSLPPIVTHNMVDNDNDPILNHIRGMGMFNHRDDRVKIVFHPEFLNSNNPLFSIDYDEFVRGCHLGIFPSFYEPWGYTGAECTVLGVPSITTNLSGFGCYMEETIENPSDYGIYILDRRLISPHESIEQLADIMFKFCQKSRRQRINQRNRTERLSDILDWNTMSLEYVKARRLALRRRFPEGFVGEEEEQSEWHQSIDDDASEYNVDYTESYEDKVMDKIHEDIEDQEDEEDNFDGRVSVNANYNKVIDAKEVADEDPDVTTPIEKEDATLMSPLVEGRKIRKPFSATTSPKLQAIKSEVESGMRELATGGLDHAETPVFSLENDRGSAAVEDDQSAADKQLKQQKNTDNLMKLVTEKLHENMKLSQQQQVGKQ